MLSCTSTNRSSRAAAISFRHFSAWLGAATACGVGRITVSPICTVVAVVSFATRIAQFHRPGASAALCSAVKVKTKSVPLADPSRLNGSSPGRWKTQVATQALDAGYSENELVQVELSPENLDDFGAESATRKNKATQAPAIGQPSGAWLKFGQFAVIFCANAESYD